MALQASIHSPEVLAGGISLVPSNSLVPWTQLLPLPPFCKAGFELMNTSKFEWTIDYVPAMWRNTNNWTSNASIANTITTAPVSPLLKEEKSHIGFVQFPSKDGWREPSNEDSPHNHVDIWKVLGDNQTVHCRDHCPEPILVDEVVLMVLVLPPWVEWADSVTAYALQTEPSDDPGDVHGKRTGKHHCLRHSSIGLGWSFSRRGSLNGWQCSRWTSLMGFRPQPDHVPADGWQDILLLGVGKNGVPEMLLLCIHFLPFSIHWISLPSYTLFLVVPFIELLGSC